jgi:hypothetical protein
MEFVLYPETYEPFRELLTADFNNRGILNLWLRVCKDLELPSAVNADSDPPPI